VGPYVPSTKWFNRNLKPYPHDPAKAKALLAQAGWKDTNGDGILDRDGKPFKFEIITNNGNAERLKTCVIIQQRLKDVGIDVAIRPIEWAAFISDFIDKKRFEATVLGWSIGLDPDQYDIWHSSKTKPKELNFISYANPEVDALLEEGRRNCGDAERRKIYDRLQEVMWEDQPLVFLYVPYALVTVHKRFHDRVTPAGSATAAEQVVRPGLLSGGRCSPDRDAGGRGGPASASAHYRARCPRPSGRARSRVKPCSLSQASPLHASLLFGIHVDQLAVIHPPGQHGDL
jgi:hypothetical protein